MFMLLLLFNDTECNDISSRFFCPILQHLHLCPAAVADSDPIFPQ